jgi:hypothetical protein
MKKLIYFLGILTANLILFGSLFKIQHWPGASALIISGLLLCCFIFLPLALWSSYHNSEEKKYGSLYLVTFIVFFTGLMGSLFKIEHWPGAAAFLLIGIPLPFILFLPVYLYQTRKEKNISSNGFLGIVFGLIFLAVFGVLLSLNVSRNILEKLTNNLRIHEQNISYSEAVLKSLTEDPKLKQQADALCYYIDDLRCELLSACGNDLCEKNILLPDYTSMSIINSDNAEIPSQILSGIEGNKLDLLQNKLSEFRKTMLQLRNADKSLESMIRELLNTEDLSSENNSFSSWQQREFGSYELIVVLNTLTRIKQDVRLAELEWVKGEN